MKQNAIRLAVASLVLIASGCSKESFNPAESVTIDADPTAGATLEILELYPDATNIKVIQANGNPNYMRWDSEEFGKCTARASGTQHRGKTPGEIIDEPFCR